MSFERSSACKTLHPFSIRVLSVSRQFGKGTAVETTPTSTLVWRLQQGREGRPDPQVRDAQLKITRRRRQRPVTVITAVVRPAIGPFKATSPNQCSQLGVNQILEYLFQQAPEQLPRTVITEMCRHISKR